MMILASVLITTTDQDEDDLPPNVTENIASFKQVHPNIPHKFFTDSSVRELIHKDFDTEILRAYDRLKPFAYKSDLARYCIMYRYGGVYADISLYFFLPWSPQSITPLIPQEAPGVLSKMGLFQDFQHTSVWDTSNGVFSTPPMHKALELAIKMVCENVRSGYYGNSDLCPTGPTLFGRAIATACRAEDLVVGKSMWIEPSSELSGMLSQRSHGYVFRKRLIAVNRKRGGQPLSDIGIAGGNVYGPMWRSRDIYDKE